ncbi:MAG: cytochrome c3 family protein [Ignavibacteria bacterium]
MRKFLLDYNLKVSLPIILFVAAATFAITYYASYAERNSIGYQPEQPIKYSHRLHAGEMKIDCQYCHVGVEKSRVASVPSADICMNCHVIAKKDSPEIQKLTKYYEEGKPIPWKRIHRVPDFAYFNHSVHVNRGIVCQSCHGEIQEMEVVAQVKNLNMGACLDCHRNAHDKLPYLKTVNIGPDNCGTCHR